MNNYNPDDNTQDDVPQMNWMPWLVIILFFFATYGIPLMLTQPSIDGQGFKWEQKE